MEALVHQFSFREVVCNAGEDPVDGKEARHHRGGNVEPDRARCSSQYRERAVAEADEAAAATRTGRRASR
jgi:hypothetical protein